MVRKRRRETGRDGERKRRREERSHTLSSSIILSSLLVFPSDPSYLIY